MYKKIILCLLIIPILFTACGRKIDTDPDTINIMCESGQAKLISKLWLTAFCYDNSIKEPKYITENDFEGYLEFNDALYKNIMTQSSDIDIFFISNMDENAYKLIEGHYYVDLSRDEVLAECFEDMYPQIRDWSTYGDEIFGFPNNYFAYMNMMVDESQTKSAGYGRGDFRTTEDLLAFCDAWRGQYAAPPVEGFSLIDWYYYNYILQHYDHESGELNLDTPEFRVLLTQCRELPQRESIFERPTEETIYSFENTYTAPILLRYYEDRPDWHPQYTRVPYPQLAGEDPDPKRPVHVIWFIINPYSQKTEKALECIRWLAGTEADEYRSCLLYRDAESYPDRDYTQALLDRVGENLTHVNAVFWFPGFSEACAPISRYVYGKADSLDDAVAEAQRILDTIRQEQYIGE